MPSNKVATRVKGRTPLSQKLESAMTPFRGVTEMSLAPVSMGNTIRSVKQEVTMNPGGGVRIVGRDYVQTLGGTSTTYNGWTLQGGLALSPIALNATGLRGFFTSYERFKWNRVVAHYITSSPTSLSGDILILYHSNHGGPKVDHTSANFLSYALSTDAALIGPQWTNHSVQIVDGKRDWISTDVLNTEDVSHQADGELLMYTKNTTNGTSPDAPGYLLIDYDVTFERRMLNPRVQTLPSGLFKWTPLAFQGTPGPILADDVWRGSITTTNSYTGVAPTLPAGIAIGDVFQVVFDISNATTGGAFTYAAGIEMLTTFGTTANIGTYTVYPITTGTTIYALCISATGGGLFAMFPSYSAVFAGNALRYAAAGSPVFASPVVMCCVGSVNNVFTQASIG